MAYVATSNVPGYLPMDDEPPVFDTAEEAWQWLADERMRGEDDTDTHVLDDESDPDGPRSYTQTVRDLENYTRQHVHAEGTVYGDTPGYDGDHDLGLAYSVTWTDVVIVDSVQVDIGAVVRQATS